MDSKKHTIAVLLMGFHSKIWLLLQKKFLITSSDIFAISSQKQFEKIALKVFRFQYENNLVYQNFVILKTDPQSKIITTDSVFCPYSF
jgi:hypothetical protein